MNKIERLDRGLDAILYIGSPHKIFAEIIEIIRLIHSDFDFFFLEEIFADLVRLFHGQYPGYRASNTKYHDLNHSCQVALAMARLFHGQVLNGEYFNHRAIQLGIIAAFFHDIGFIQTQDDMIGTGAKYTIGHEERSISLARTYLAAKGMNQDEIDDCCQIICCTILSLSPADISFRTPDVKLLGWLLGSADIIGQMAEREYLEKIPFLYEEFKEGGVPGYESTLDLFKKSDMFYQNVALKRLNIYFHSVYVSIRDHFMNRWHLDRELYSETIANSMAYLVNVKRECPDSIECLQKKLRRRLQWCKSVIDF